MEGEQEGPEVRVGLVTCPLFPKLTGDDRLLYRALVEALQPAAGGERKPAAPTTGRAKSRPRAKAPSEDDPTSGPVHIVQWSDPGGIYIFLFMFFFQLFIPFLLPSCS